MILPADCNAWGQACINAYNLVKKEIEVDGAKIHLFGRKRSFGKKYWSTAPYTGDGGVILNNQSNTINVINAIDKEIPIQEQKYILLKTRDNFFEGVDKRIIVNKSFCNLVLDIRGDADYVWTQKISSKTRNQIRKGLKQKIRVVIGREELLGDFYKVISKVWLDLGTPTHSQLFFREIIKCFGEHASFIIVYYNNQPVATALLIIRENTIFHPFAGTIRSFNPLSINNVLYWKIIEFACENQLEYFDMGKSPKNKGTYRFKISWGTEPIQLYYNFFTTNIKTIPDYHNSQLTQLAVKYWKKMPLPLANLFGPKLIYNVLL